MGSNAFLSSFGMKPGDFDRTEGSVESDDGFVYEAWAPSSWWPENGWGFKESEEGTTMILFFCI